MKKAALQASNDSIRNDPDFITPDEDCDNRDLTLENDYGEIRVETSAFPIWTTPQSNTTRPYSNKFAKQGTFVTMTFGFKSPVGTTIPPSKIFTFLDTVAGQPSDLIPDDTIDSFTGEPQRFEVTARTPNGTQIRMAVRKSPTEGFGFFALDSIPPTSGGAAFYGELTYFVKE